MQYQSLQSFPCWTSRTGERVDAIVEMKNPGIWIFGELEDAQRAAGAGIVVEYGGAQGKPRWVAPSDFQWDVSTFGESRELAASYMKIPFVVEPGKDGYLWALNGKSWPNGDEIALAPGVRNRLVFENHSIMGHPVHLHRTRSNSGRAFERTFCWSPRTRKWKWTYSPILQGHRYSIVITSFIWTSDLWRCCVIEKPMLGGNSNRQP